MHGCLFLDSSLSFFLSAFFLVVSCVIFPFGWDNIEVRQACGETANNYELGNCKLGWAAFLIAAGTVATLVCSWLSVSAGKSDRMKASAYDARYDTIRMRQDGNHF